MTADAEMRDRIKALELQAYYTNESLNQIKEQQKLDAERQQKLFDLLNKALGARWVIFLLLGVAGVMSWHTVLSMLGIEHK